jgi:hemerythrin HHE cation binding domain-containing protein
MASAKAVVSSVLAVGLLLGFQEARAQPDAAAGPTAKAPASAEIRPAATAAQAPSAPAGEPHAHGGAGEFTIPKSMQIEHEELHADLAQLTRAGGKTGEAAKQVAAVLDDHFAKENEYALPPLGLLVPLSQGKFDCGMTGVLKMTDELEAEMPTMLSEHKDIAASLRMLSDAAKAEGKPQGMQFAEMLTAHALGEEEITYPTALLIGRYVKSKAASCAR